MCKMSFVQAKLKDTRLTKVLFGGGCHRKLRVSSVPKVKAGSWHRACQTTGGQEAFSHSLPDPFTSSSSSFSSSPLYLLGHKLGLLLFFPPKS